MFTPQQIEQISFKKATFNGYDTVSVDAVLEPLTEDYITLYKENALLKSKMRVLVAKLEEYRQNEASMKDAIVNAQKTCDLMVKDAEGKCAQMLSEANQAAAENAKHAAELIALEQARVEEAKRDAAARIEEMEKQFQACLDALAYIKNTNRPAELTPAAESASTEAVADEISRNLESMIGEAEDTAPKADPKHPESDTNTRFVGLKFGRNYNPNR